MTNETVRASLDAAKVARQVVISNIQKIKAGIDKLQGELQKATKQLEQQVADYNVAQGKVLGLEELLTLETPVKEPSKKVKKK